MSGDRQGKHKRRTRAGDSFTSCSAASAEDSWGKGIQVRLKSITGSPPQELTSFGFRVPSPRAGEVRSTPLASGKVLVRLLS